MTPKTERKIIGAILALCAVGILVAVTLMNLNIISIGATAILMVGALIAGGIAVFAIRPGSRSGL